MLNEVINMISVLEICYVAIFAITSSIIVDTLIHYKGGRIE